MVLHGAVSADPLSIATPRASSCWPVAPILEAIREKNPGFLIKTTEIEGRFAAASQRYEAMLKTVEARRQRMAARQEYKRPLSCSAQAADGKVAHSLAGFAPGA